MEQGIAIFVSSSYASFAYATTISLPCPCSLVHKKYAHLSITPQYFLNTTLCLNYNDTRYSYNVTYFHRGNILHSFYSFSFPMETDKTSIFCIPLFPQTTNQIFFFRLLETYSLLIIQPQLDYLMEIPTKNINNMTNILLRESDKDGALENLTL